MRKIYKQNILPVKISQSTIFDFFSSAGEGGSPYEWALSLWWDQWFPEVLEEYKQIVAAYSTSKTSYTLNYYGLQPGGSRSYRTLLPKKTKKDHKPEEK